MGSETTKSPPSSESLLDHLVNLDKSISLHLYKFFNPKLPYTFLKSLELSGDGRLFFPILISSLLFSLSNTNNNNKNPIFFPILINLLIGSLIDLILIGTIKHLVKRPRPIYNKHMFLVAFSVDHWSFPSGHSSRVWFVTAFSFFYSDQLTLAFSTLGESESCGFLLRHFVLVVGIWAWLTSVSRVLLGRHFVCDVLVGACLGVLEGVLVVRVFNYENFVGFFEKNYYNPFVKM